MTFDQVHEQNNIIIKGLEGASNFLNIQDDSALIRWELCGPEVARIVAEFEESLDNRCMSANELKHPVYSEN